MAIIQATNKKQYAQEAQLLLRILASGVKLTDAVIKNLKITPGVSSEKDSDGKVVREGKSGDSINWGKDDVSGDVFIYKADEGSLVGANKTFTNTSLKMELLSMAKGSKIEGGEGTIQMDTEIKGGLQVRFEVAEKPVVEGGVEYFKVTFKDAIIPAGADDEEADAPQAEKSNSNDF